jgi:RES domain-containing protein
VKVYRIAKKAYIKNLTGEGARLYGGRWNKKGTAMLYTASNRSLATVEFLVHLPMTLIPKDVYIVELTLPPHAKSQTISKNDLVDGWQSYPANYQLAELGNQWIQENKTLIFKVPSSVVQGECNILINPNHRLFSKVAISKIEAYNIDKRLIRKNT